MSQTINQPPRRPAAQTPALPQGRPAAPPAPVQPVVAVAPAPQAQAANTIQAASLERVAPPSSAAKKAAKFFDKALTGLALVAAAPVKLAAAATVAVAAVPVYAVAKAGEAITDKADRVEQRQQDLRAALGTPLNPTVLDKNLAGGGTVRQAMETLRTQHLGGDARVTAQEMEEYIAMGERLIHALDQAPGKTNSLSFQARTTATQAVFTLVVESNLETTRAISWYLQAKAIADNHDGQRAEAYLTEGAMIAKDPGNKLYHFLRAAPETNGRASSHMAERSDNSETALSGLKGLVKGGFMTGALTGLAGQPLQYGTEDYDKRMPSMGGALLFDRLKPSVPGTDPEIYLKWEPVGMPSSIGLVGTASNDLVSEKVSGVGKALVSQVKHTLNFAANANPTDYRGEKMEKGQARVIADKFATTLRGIANIDAKITEALIRQVNTFGAAEMDRVLTGLLNSAELQNDAQALRDLTTLKGDLADWMDDMGAPIAGLARKGAEVHVSLV